MGADMHSQYKTLNDAAVFEPGLAPGRTEIWYMTKQTWQDYRGFVPDELPPLKSLKKSHILLGKVKETNKDVLFKALQGEFWSPNGEARSLIRSKGLVHTSMSVGDVIVVGNKGYMVDMVGWKNLTEGLNVVENKVGKTTNMIISKGETDMENIDRLIEAVKNQKMTGEEAALALTNRGGNVRLVEKLECPLCDDLLEDESDLGKHLVATHDFSLDEAKDAVLQAEKKSCAPDDEEDDEEDDMDEEAAFESILSTTLDEMLSEGIPYYSCPECKDEFGDVTELTEHLKHDHDFLGEDIEVHTDDLGEKTVRVARQGKMVTIKKRVKKMSGALRAKMAQILKKARKKAHTGAAKLMRKKSMRLSK